MKTEYSILDPTGNVTILVTTPVAALDQPGVASKLMELTPDAEQVGFLSHESGCDIALRMAGGEFCGNASMCAAVMAALENSVQEGEMMLHVSGAQGPVMAEVRKLPDGSWRGKVDMPRPIAINNVNLPGAGMLPVVSFDGISHVIYEVSSSDIGAEAVSTGNLPVKRTEAEKLVTDWCRYLGTDALGIMFLDADAGRMTPLVYVPAAGTLFWENSCASGTTACGAYLAKKAGGSCTTALLQPGGALEISAVCDGPVRLTGNVRVKERKSAEIMQGMSECEMHS